MSNKNGGPAFPVADYDHQVFQPKNEAEAKRYLSGMSLRDYFAASAVNGLMGRVWDADKCSGEEIVKKWATSAYAVADAMLAARSQP